MNKIVFSALAMSMASASGFASDTDWPELDRELAALNKAPLTQDADGPYVSGWLIGTVVSNNDKDDPATGTKDQLSSGVAGARINVGGSVGHGYEFKLGFDFTDTNELFDSPSNSGAAGIAGEPIGPGRQAGIAGLTDAYIKFDVGGQVGVQLGVFTARFLRSADIQRNHTMFINRSYLGGLNSAREAGVALNGSFDRINWQVAAMNGHSGSQDDFALSGHVDVDVIGVSSEYEGGYGAAEGTNLNIGLTYRSDSSDTTVADTIVDANGDGLIDIGLPAVGTNRNDDVLAVDAALTMGAFSVWGELVDYDDDSLSYQNGAGTGSTPYSIGTSYSFGQGYEVAFRWDDYDTIDNVTRYHIGVNRYIAGHDLKWQLEYSSGNDDDRITSDEQNDVIAFGLALGF